MAIQRNDFGTWDGDNVPPADYPLLRAESRRPRIPALGRIHIDYRDPIIGY
jgi:hypothetical protein